jgi:hypothetical protein
VRILRTKWIAAGLICLVSGCARAQDLKSADAPCGNVGAPSTNYTTTLNYLDTACLNTQVANCLAELNNYTCAGAVRQLHPPGQPRYPWTKFACEGLPPSGPALINWGPAPGLPPDVAAACARGALMYDLMENTNSADPARCRASTQVITEDGLKAYTKDIVCALKSTSTAPPASNNAAPSPPPVAK